MKALLALLLGFANTLLRGVLIKSLWGWFVLTLFPTLPHLGVLAAVGLSMFVHSVSIWKTFTAPEIADKDADPSGTMVYNGVIYSITCLLGLFSGWVVHYFMVM
jgi:hypothetical protein